MNKEVLEHLKGFDQAGWVTGCGFAGKNPNTRCGPGNYCYACLDRAQHQIDSGDAFWRNPRTLELP